jgi:CspA family cold shock protein
MSAIEKRETGSVKWFSADKGYGFITTNAGEDLFVHYSAILGDGYKCLNGGDEVSFSVVAGDKGLQASDVEVVTENGPRQKRRVVEK